MEYLSPKQQYESPDWWTGAFPPHSNERKDRPKKTEPPEYVQGTLFDVGKDGEVIYYPNEPKESVAHRAARKAADLVSGDRNTDYGHPLDDFTKQAKMWSVIFGVDVTPEKVALAMICVKIARQLNRPLADNIHDGCGYWLTLAMIEHERDLREKRLNKEDKDD